MKDILMGNGQFSDATPTSSSSPDDSPCRICGSKDALCGGLGVVRYNVPVGDPHFGKLFRCPHNPVENDIERQMKLRKLSNLGAFAEKSFENFFTRDERFTPAEVESLEHAFRIAQNFAERPQGWLLLEGTYGCGKTHLAAAIANERLTHGDTVLFITSPDLLDHLRGAYAPTSEVTYDELFDRVRNTRLLVLDDLGVENPSQWAQEKLFQLLNYRYNHNLPTVITTNCDIDDLDARVRSRLLDEARTWRVKIRAPDFRTSRADERIQLASSLNLYAHMTFDTFDPFSSAYNEEAAALQRALQTAKAYARQPEGAWLMFVGRYGTGKTHLAAAIANYNVGRSGRSDDVMFITVSDLMDYLRMTFAPESNIRFDQRFHQIKNVRLLVLDDLGAEASSGWAKEKLFQLLDYRYVTRQSTVMTTSKNIEALDERIRTRVFDTRLCSLVGLDLPGYVERMRRK
jgi:DNA replication protein DnaC